VNLLGCNKLRFYKIHGGTLTF